jgi:PEP-CTERM motif
MKMRITSLPLLAILYLTLSAPAFAQTIFAGGPINGRQTGLFITGPNNPNFKGSFQDISDGFFPTNPGTPTTLEFGLWIASGFTPSSVAYEFGTTAFGADVGSGTTVLNAANSLFLFNNGFGYDIYDVTIPVNSTAMTAGTQYWVTLSNATDASNSGTEAWDYNGGPATCNYRQSGTNLGNCASGATILAEHTTPQDGEGESFTLSGSQATTPEPSSILLFGSGILGLAGVLRRKLKA